MKHFTIISIICIIYLKYVKSGTDLRPTSVEACEGVEQLSFIEFKKIEGKPDQLWFGNVTVPFIIDSNSEFLAELRFWKNGNWDQKPQSFKGKLCFYLNKFGAKLWQQFRKAVKPPIESDCPVPQGTYVIDSFEPDYSGVFMPMMKNQKWRSKVSISKNGKEFCLIVAGELKK